MAATVDAGQSEPSREGSDRPEIAGETRSPLYFVVPTTLPTAAGFIAASPSLQSFITVAAAELV